MRALFLSREFRGELADWTLRGVLCAATSAFWAALLGFTSVAEVAGMLLGVGCWIVAFALVGASARRTANAAASDRRRLKDGRGRAGLAEALGWAAWIKLGLTGVAWLLYGFAGFFGLQNLLQVALLGMTDTLLGIAALWAVSWVAGVVSPDRVAGLDSFGWTLLTTLTEGALMAFMIAGLAFLLVAFWRVRAAFGPALTLSPVR
jgi:hypothetical protein